MSVVSFVAAQRAEHGVPHAVSCRALRLSESRRLRRDALDAAVKAAFEASDGDYGSPRVLAELREGLDGVEEERRGLHAPPGPGGSTQTPLPPPDPGRSGRGARPRPAPAGLLGPDAQPEVVRGADRDTDRGGQARPPWRT